MPQTQPPADDGYLSPNEAAELISVTIKSLHRWEDEGLIHSLRTPGGHRRYSRADVLALIAEKSA